MTARAARPIWLAVLGPLAGLSLALGLAALSDDGRGREMVAYGLGTSPLAAALGGLAGARSSGQSEVGRASRVTGAVGALIGALAAAYVQAAVRFSLMGSTGLPPVATLPHARELLMVVGLLPAILLAGAAIDTRPRGRSWVPFLGGAATGTLGSLFAGPTLILTATLGRLPLLGPLVVTALVVGLVALAARRR